MEFAYTITQIFNLFTNGGKAQGIYMYKGLLYLNGQYMKSLCVVTEALATNAVTTEKLQAGAVTVEKIDLKDAQFIKGSSFALHPTLKFQYNGNTYSFQGFAQAKKVLEAVKSACGA